MSTAARLVAATSMGALAGHLWTVPDQRGSVLLLVEMLCWILDSSD